MKLRIQIWLACVLFATVVAGLGYYVINNIAQSDENYWWQRTGVK